MAGSELSPPALPAWIRCERLYESLTGPGYRVLADRLWPRGVAKARLEFDEWCKDVTPSAPLRTAFHARELDFPTFARLYREELKVAEASATLLDRFHASGKTPLTLLYGSKEPVNNHANVLASHLVELSLNG